MKSHFSDLPDFLYAVVHKLGLYIFVGVGIIFLLIAYFLSITDAETTLTVTIVIATVALFFAAYGVYREERTMRRDREQDVRVTATLGSLSANMPDPGPDKVSLAVRVIWEVWANRDVSTDKLALNLIYVYESGGGNSGRKLGSPKKASRRMDRGQHKSKDDSRQQTIHRSGQL